MNTIDIGTGLSLTFLATGGLKYMYNPKLDRCVKINTSLGLTSTLITGVLYVYRGL